MITHYFAGNTVAVCGAQPVSGEEFGTCWALRKVTCVECARLEVEQRRELLQDAIRHLEALQTGATP